MLVLFCQHRCRPGDRSFEGVPLHLGEGGDPSKFFMPPTTFLALPASFTNCYIHVASATLCHTTTLAYDVPACCAPSNILDPWSSNPARSPPAQRRNPAAPGRARHWFCLPLTSSVTPAFSNPARSVLIQHRHHACRHVCRRAGAAVVAVLAHLPGHRAAPVLDHVLQEPLQGGAGERTAAPHNFGIWRSSVPVIHNAASRKLRNKLSKCRTHHGAAVS